MTSRRPYLLRAMYEWVLDNDLTPHIIVAADYPGVVVPTEYVEDDRIVLNISPSATQGLDIGNDALMFSGRFSGHSIELYVPVGGVVGIYARENGQGMIFDDPVPEDEPPSPPSRDEEDKKPARPSLRVVK